MDTKKVEMREIIEGEVIPKLKVPSIAKMVLGVAALAVLQLLIGGPAEKAQSSVKCFEDDWDGGDLLFDDTALIEWDD